MKRLALLLSLLLAGSLAIAAPKNGISEVVEAERAFARAAQVEGVNAAFLRFAAPDGLVFQPDPVPAHAALAARPIPPVPLDWWPAYAGIAASGDLGFTTGPYVAGSGDRKGHGWYFTIWKRQADGRWRWLLDHGPPTREAAPLGKDGPVAALPAGRRSHGAAAFAAVREAEARLARALAADARAALPRFLAADGRLMRPGPQPAVGEAAWAPILAAGPARIECETLGGTASAAGDLAFTYGKARWERDGKGPVRAYYVRIWQRRPGGWALIVDNLIPTPPSPAPTAP